MREGQGRERLMTDELEVRVPPRLLFGGGFRDDEAAVRYGVCGIERMCQVLDLEDLRDIEVLDVGCGFAFTVALINRSLPVRRYVGIDVNEEMVEFLRGSVDDPRFEYYRLDAHNDMYNPDGKPLGETALPLESRKFDLICLFSVFTHLAPADYVMMLKLLRNYVKPDGRLFFSLYIDELTEEGHGLMDEIVRRGHKLGHATGKIDTFADLHPRRSLEWAVYSERYARELIDRTGWTALSLLPPQADPSSGATFVQHHFVCAPKSPKAS
jgi:SAM-dependent methyltransferase